MFKAISLVILVGMVLLSVGCAEIIVTTTLDGQGQIDQFSMGMFTEDRMGLGLISDLVYESYINDYDGENKPYVYYESFRHEAPYGAQITIDLNEARRLGRGDAYTKEMTMGSGSIYKSFGVREGREYVHYYTEPTPDYKEEEFDQFLTISIVTISPRSEKEHVRSFSFRHASQNGFDFIAYFDY